MNQTLRRLRTALLLLLLLLRLLRLLNLGCDLIEFRFQRFHLLLQRFELRLEIAHFVSVGDSRSREDERKRDGKGSFDVHGGLRIRSQGGCGFAIERARSSINKPMPAFIAVATQMGWPLHVALPFVGLHDALQRSACESRAVEDLRCAYTTSKVV